MTHPRTIGRVRSMALLGVAAMGALAGAVAGCASQGPVSEDAPVVLDSQRWLFEDQADALSEGRLHRGGRLWSRFFSPDRGSWDEVGEQISDSTDRIARLAQPWPARNPPAQNVNLLDEK